MGTGFHARIWRQTESPSTSGRFRSSTTRSGSKLRTAPRASPPSTATSTRKPRAMRARPTARRMLSSSSTTSTRPFFTTSWDRPHGASRGGLHRAGGGEGEAERGAAAGGLPDPDLPAHQLEETLADRQPEAGAQARGALAHPVEREEELVPQRRRHSP